MDTATAAALLLPLVVVAIAAGVTWHLYARRLDLKREVLVVLRSGETIRGVLIERRADRLILGNAAVLGNGGETPIDGTVELDRDNVTWVQVP